MWRFDGVDAVLTKVLLCVCAYVCVCACGLGSHVQETDLSAAYFAVPKITRWMVSAAFGLTVISNLGFLPFLAPFNLILNYYLVLHKFQIWRLVTSVFFFGKLGFPFVINMIFMYRYSLQLETGLFDGRRADFVFMLLFQTAILWIVAFFMQLVVLGPCLCVAMIYVWSQVNRDQIVTFWFGLRFKAMYFPWVRLFPPLPPRARSPRCGRSDRVLACSA